MEKRNKRVVDLLKERQLLNDEIADVNYHMNLLSCNVDYLNTKIPSLFDKDDNEIANFVVDVFTKCDARHESYDPKIDETMTRIGLKTDVFYPGKNPNLWNNGMFHDDGFGFGTEATSIYDDYIDSMSNDDRSR